MKDLALVTTCKCGVAIRLFASICPVLALKALTCKLCFWCIGKSCFNLVSGLVFIKQQRAIKPLIGC